MSSQEEVPGQRTLVIQLQASVSQLKATIEADVGKSAEIRKLRYELEELLSVIAERETTIARLEHRVVGMDKP